VGIACFAAVAVASDWGVQAHRVGLFYLGLAAFRYFCRLDDARIFAVNVALGTALVLSDPLTLRNAALDLDTAVCVAGPLAAVWLVMSVRSPPRIVLFFSRISYSLYLLHMPIGTRFIHLTERFVPGALGNVLALMGALILCVLAACIWYRLIELPSLRASKRFSYRARHSHERAAFTPGQAPARV
jgi:peptidoglycan/LPS O-acetylase OafA/YrhL